MKTHNDAEVERLCGYTKNDSLVRWHLGCTQEQVDAARARIAKRPQHGFAYLGKRHQGGTGEDELKVRTARAMTANRRFLQAMRRAHG